MYNTYYYIIFILKITKISNASLHTPLSSVRKRIHPFSPDHSWSWLARSSGNSVHWVPRLVNLPTATGQLHALDILPFSPQREQNRMGLKRHPSRRCPSRPQRQHKFFFHTGMRFGFGERVVKSHISEISGYVLRSFIFKRGIFFGGNSVSVNGVTSRL